MCETPNLFRFAPSELSQDAFISWLISWADRSFENSHTALHKTARQLIQSLVATHGKTSNTPYDAVQVKRQYKNIDVLVLLDNQTLILIEDKVNSSTHSNQLETYREVVEEDFPEHQRYLIFFKTGDQSNYDWVENNHYQPFLRSSFLKILAKGVDRGIRNDIYLEYESFLSSIENEVQSFSCRIFKLWRNPSWIGFFKQLQLELPSGNWGYIPNKKGGFMSFWWSPDSSGQLQSAPYIQLEKELLCFKIRVAEKEQRKTARDFWHHRIVSAGSTIGLDIRKPARFGNGVHMTVAKLEGSYIAFDNQSILKFQETLNRVKIAEDVLLHAIAQSS